MSVVIRPSPRGDPRPCAPLEAVVTFAPDASQTGCILEPVCLEQFVFSACPHPEVPCVRHHLERLAEGEGQRAYGEVAWRTMKSVDPIAVVQMIEEMRSKDSSAP